VAVRGKPAVTPTARQHGRRRYTSVDPATPRSTGRHDDTPRDREETAHLAAQTQLVSRFHGGWSIKKFVRTTLRYRTVQIRAGQHILTAEDALPPDLRDALALIN
jgi:hypothetical protein